MRLSDDALAFALTWCREGYEGDDDTPGRNAFVSWAIVETRRRQENKIIYQAAKKANTTVDKIRALPQTRKILDNLWSGDE